MANISRAMFEGINIGIAINGRFIEYAVLGRRYKQFVEIDYKILLLPLSFSLSTY